MRKLIYLFALALALGGCRHTPATPSFYGRYTAAFKNGAKVLAVYRENGTHDYFINDKPFSSGQFELRHDTLLEADPICHPDYYACYIVTFLSRDSVQLKVVQDTCQPRVYDLDGIVLTREKK